MRATVTGSVRVDLWLCALLAGWVVASSSALRVYYRVTVMEVEAFAVAPDGRRSALPPLSDTLWRQPSATLPAR